MKRAKATPIVKVSGGYVKPTFDLSRNRFSYKHKIGLDQKRVLAEKISKLLKKRISPRIIKPLKFSQFIWATDKLNTEKNIAIAYWCLNRRV